jgi:Txe/YoeB family toxin of Txe-Axe toxin-antitoxin module
MDWGVVYYKAEDGTVPADAFLDACPAKVEATILAVLEMVRAAPPPAFSGGGKWEAMHGTMSGYYEIRVTGPGRTHYRLFCILDNGTDDELQIRGFDRPQIAVINGMVKPNAALFTDGEYRKYVRALGDEYLATTPRRIGGSE